MADFSGLGTAEEIAAAAMAAAGLESLLGIQIDGADTATAAEEQPPQQEEEAQSTVKIEETAQETDDSIAPHTETEPAARGIKRDHDQISRDTEAKVEEKPRPNPSSVAASKPTISASSLISSTLPAQSKAAPAQPLKTAAQSVPTSTASFKPTTTPSAAKPATADQSSSDSSTSASAAFALLSGIHNLEAVAQAAMGLDANGNPLPGNEESHRALADAVKRLSAHQNDPRSAASKNGSSSKPGASPAQKFQPSSSYIDGEDVEKKFQCNLCDRRFARAYNLNTHLATHDPDPAKSKPFSCPYPSCKADGGRSFSRKHDLQRHVASTHEDEPIPEDEEEIDENGTRISIVQKLGLAMPGRKFRCEDCGRTFVRRDTLRRHQCAPSTDYSSSSAAATGQYPSVNASSQAGRPSLPKPLNNRGPMNTEAVSIPTGLSLYTSTTPTQVSNTAAKSSAASSKAATRPGGTGANDTGAAFPAGLSYESLSREVQDMAMQLVAQATTYNESFTNSGSSSQSAASDALEAKSGSAVANGSATKGT